MWLGLRSATRCAAAACWALWADALGMISRQGGEDQGELPFPPGSCMAELFDASAPPSRP